MNSIRISPWDGPERIQEGRDVMLDVVHVSEVQISDPFPQHGVGPDQVGGISVRLLGTVQVHSGVGEENGRLGLGFVLAQHEVSYAVLGA